MASRRIVVVIDDAHQRRIAGIADALRDRGMRVEEVLDTLGMITGTYDGRLAELSKVKGVASAEDETPFELPPPDAPVQ